MNPGMLRHRVISSIGNDAAIYTLSLIDPNSGTTLETYELHGGETFDKFIKSDRNIDGVFEMDQLFGSPKYRKFVRIDVPAGKISGDINIVFPERILDELTIIDVQSEILGQEAIDCFYIEDAEYYRKYGALVLPRLWFDVYSGFLNSGSENLVSYLSDNYSIYNSNDGEIVKLPSDVSTVDGEKGGNTLYGITVGEIYDEYGTDLKVTFSSTYWDLSYFNNFGALLFVCDNVGFTGNILLIEGYANQEGLLHLNFPSDILMQAFDGTYQYAMLPILWN